MTLVLVDAGGRVLGQLPPFEAETPWWQDIAPVVRGARLLHGARVTVLRLLTAERLSAQGGAVSYLAEVDGAAALPAALTPWSGELEEDPKRLPYARVGGPAADLAWARGVLHDRGEDPVGEPEQIRTWNLSSLWRVPTRSGCAWLKVVPPFFAHEGRVLEALAGEPVPRLLGRDGPRLLLAEIPGTDRYEADLAERLRMVDLLVGLQARWRGRIQELLALGLMDARGPAFQDQLARVYERCAVQLAAADRQVLESFLADLPRRFAALAACGLEDGLVHADFHPGNLRGDAGSLTLLDWGDCCVGHPLLDQAGLWRATPAAEVEVTRAHWHAAWAREVPGADCETASRLLAPIGAARGAIVYQRFLDHIEQTEHPYHSGDVVACLERTAAVLRETPSS